VLETEIKKLTEAVHALTAVMNQGATHANAPTPTVTTPASTAPTPAAEPTAPTPAAAQAPAAVEQAAQPAAPTEISFDQLKSQLAAIIQKMNDGGAAVAGLIGQQPSTTGQPPRLLSEVDPGAYAQLLETAKGLTNA
jgi:hypothetical protein